MAVIDPRQALDQARARNQVANRTPRVTTFQQAMQPVSYAPQAGQVNNNDLIALANKTFTDSKRRNEALAIARGDEASVGGWRGLVGGVLENPIVHTALKPLEVLDIPRRVVISAVQEGADALNGGDASWGDFVKQAEDPSFGFGTVIGDATGNKWINRALGFIGDVALDPMTYATFGGNQVAGAAGRTEIARKALDVGLGAERAAEIARFGRAAMTAEELQRVGLNRSGIYFFGKRLPAVRVPGSGMLGEMGEKGLTHLRIAASETTIGQLAQKAFTPNVNREARLALARGEVAGDQAERYIRLVTSRNSQRVAETRALQLNRQRLEALAPHVDGQSRHTIYEVFEGLRDPSTLSPAEQVTYNNLKGFFSDLHGEADAAVKTVDAAAGWGVQDNYFPWMRSDKAQKYMASPSSPFISDLKKGFDDGDPLGIFQHRTIAAKVKAGQDVTWFGTKLTVDDLNVKRLNELARKAGFDGDFFETDILRVADSYARQQASQMGLIARYSDLKAAGVFEEFDTRIKDVSVVDAEAVKRQAKHIKDLTDEHHAMTQGLGDTIDSVIKTMQGRSEVLGDRVARVGEIADVARQTRVDTQGVMIATKGELNKARATLDNQYKALHALFEGDIPVAAQPIADDLQRTTQELEQFNNMFGALMAQAESGVVVAKTARKELEDRAALLKQRLTELEQSRQRMIEFNDLITKQFDQIASGKATKDSALNMLGRAIGTLPETDGSRKAFGRLFATPGEVDKWIKGELGKLEWHGKVNSVERIAPSSVAAMNTEKVSQIIAEAAGGGRAMGDVRAAAMWQLARDDKFFASLPPELQELRTQLLDVMGEADQADAFLRTLGTAEISGRKSIELNTRAQELELALGKAEGDLKTLRMMDEALATGEYDGIVLDGQMAASVQAQADELRAKQIKVGQGAGAETFSLTDFEEGGKAFKRLDELRGKVSILGGNARTLRENPARVQARLAEALGKYQLASEVQYRMALTAQMLAPFGMVPGEGMMRTVINSVAKNHAEHWTNRVSQLTTVKAVVEDMREKFAQQITKVGFSQDGPGARAGVLRDLIRDAFDGPDGNAVKAVLGPIVGNAEDPTEMLRMMRPSNPSRSSDIKDVIRPWWEANYGKWVSQDAAKAKLKEAKALGKTPFARNATSRDVEEFFISILGGQVRGPAQLQRLGGRTVTESASWMRSVPGSLDEEIMRAVQNEQLFRAAADPMVDVHRFLLAPGVAQDVPSFYATTLRNAADELDRIQGRVAGEFDRLKPGMDPRKGLIGDDPKWVRQVRKDVDLLDRRKQSVDYTLAQMDEEMHTAMMDMAAIDGWKVVDTDGNAGFLTETGERVSFTREEWESLYRGVDGPAVKELQSEQGRLMNDLKKLGKQREQLVKGLESAPPRGRNVQLATIRDLDEQLYDVQKRLTEVRRQAVVASEQTQQSALEKMRILVHGADDDARRSFLTSPGSHAVDASVVNARREAQAAAHAVSPSRKFLDEVDALERSTNVKAYRGWLAEGAKVQRHAEKLRAAAAHVESRVATAMGLQGVDTQPLRLIADSLASPGAFEDAAIPGAMRSAAEQLGQVTPPSELRAVRTGPQIEQADNLLQATRLEQPMVDQMAAAAKKAEKPAEKQAAEAKKALSKKLETLSTRQQTLIQALDDSVEKAIRTTADSASNQRATIKQLEETLQDAASKYESAKVIGQSAEDVQKRIVPQMEKRLADYQDALAGAPTLGKGRKKNWTPEQLSEMSTWARNARLAVDLGRRNPDDPLAKLLLSAAKAESDLIYKRMSIQSEEALLKSLRDGITNQEISRYVREGYSDLKNLGLPGLQGNAEIENMLVNMQKLEQPAFAREVNRLMGGQLRFFKAYATLSPGFHVRNAMGNTFMMLAAGSDPRNLTAGFKLYREMEGALKSGKTVEQWLLTLPEEQRALATVAADAMHGVGGGRTAEQLDGMLQKGSKINDNKLLRASQRVGNFAEGSAHFMLGYDSAVKGLDSGMATARVKRYLFDYRDVSAADENIRSIVPFWTWMSRNLPLQMVNQWANPKMYQIYGSFVRNFSEEDNSVVPLWMRQGGAFKMSGDTYATPDFGFNRLDETLQQVGNPTQLLSYVNPLLRVPAELYASKQFYSDIPIKDKPEQLAAGPLSEPLTQLASVLGLTDTNAQGDQLVNPKLNYLLKNMLPPLAQAQRLLPSTERGKENQGNALLGYMGIPIRNVNEGDRRGELYRREQDINDLAAAARALGLTP